MNLFEQYGIKEVADVTLYAIELDENDDEIYIPVLYMDTLKVSTVEESTQQTSAQGGIGNPKLITWDYGKDITVTLNDALFTPASNSMNWGGKLGAKGLQLSLQYFFDRNTDYNTPDTCLRTGTLYAEEFSDFFTILDIWPSHEDINCHCEHSIDEEKQDGEYVGGTSIYCWLVNGHIISNDGEKRIEFKNLILFYREQTQKWYFYNVWWALDAFDDSISQINYYFETYNQFSKYVFETLKTRYSTNEPIEKVAKATWETLENLEPETPEFLTQNLYINGYKRGCEKDKMYVPITTDVELQAIRGHQYLPYRYFANVGVEYNTNVVPPQDVIYQIDTAYKNVRLIERIEKCQATKCFCIDTDVNMKHGQYRYLNKYSEMELTVFIDPKTMQPYQTNAFEYYRNTGERITGNLRIIRQGETYYKWTRQKAKQHEALGRQIIIDPQHYPGTYRLVGETSKRDRYGNDHRYQFEIPLCKLHADNKITLQADGDPTVFTMKLTALRRYDGVMMKLTEYDVIPKEYCKDISGSSEIVPFVDPNPELNPIPHDVQEGLASGIDFTLTTKEKRDIASTITLNDIEGFMKTSNQETTNSDVRAHLVGKADVGMKSVDGTWITKERKVVVDRLLAPEEYNATVAVNKEE